jgi:FMN phosphatase YigB (HAD superfamily)
VKPILFIDFDGTICYDRFWRSLSPDQYEIAQNFLFGTDRTYLREWMIGKRTSEEINNFLAPKLGLALDELWKIFVKDCETMYVSPEILEKIQILRTTYIVICSTGNMDCFMRFTVPALGLENYFDHISSSYDEKMTKTDEDGAVFKKYIQKYGAQTNECILMDDSQSVCDIFRSLGGTSHLITQEKDILYYLETL